MAVNTTKSMSEVDESIRAKVEKSLKRAAERMEKEKKVKVSIPENFKRAIGETLYLNINGVKLVLPVDGKTYSVPEPFADHLRDYLAQVTF